MIDEPSREALERIPLSRSIEKLPPEKQVIFLHFYIGGCHWYVAGFDGRDTFLGYVNLNDERNAEWGYFTLSELRELEMMTNVQDRDTGEILGQLPFEVVYDTRWTARPFSYIKRRPR